MRRTVWIPDELDALARAELPGLNWSAALQHGVRALVACQHPNLTCSDCGASMTLSGVNNAALDRFFLAVVGALADRVDLPGYEGAARIVINTARRHRIPVAAAYPMPRPGRSDSAAEAAERDYTLRRLARQIEHRDAQESARLNRVVNHPALSRANHPTQRKQA